VEADRAAKMHGDNTWKRARRHLAKEQGDGGGKAKGRSGAMVEAERK